MARMSESEMVVREEGTSLAFQSTNFSSKVLAKITCSLSWSSVMVLHCF